MTEKYKKLDIDYELPDDLENAINDYVHFLNTGEGLADTPDYYTMEIMLSLNWCYRDRILNEDQIRELRDYYQHGGILGGKSNGSDI